jgi:hypothetical protein
VGVNKGVNKKYFHTNSVKARVSVIERREPKGVKLKMRGRKLRSGVYWQGALNQEGVKQRLLVA